MRINESQRKSRKINENQREPRKIDQKNDENIVTRSFRFVFCQTFQDSLDSLTMISEDLEEHDLD